LGVVDTRVKMFSGFSMAPPACPATKKRWFGYEGPATDAKTLSQSTNRFAQRK